MLPLCSEECLPGPLQKQLHLQNKALKCTSRFLRLIHTNSVWSYPVGVFIYDICFGSDGSLAPDMAWYQASKPNQHLFAASGRVEEGPFSATMETEGMVEFLFYSLIVISPGMHHPNFLSRASGNFHTFKRIFYFILFFLISTDVTQTGTTTASQNRPENNDIQGLTPQSSRLQKKTSEAIPLGAVLRRAQDSRQKNPCFVILFPNSHTPPSVSIYLSIYLSILSLSMVTSRRFLTQVLLLLTNMDLYQAKITPKSYLLIFV